jgi:hypothetical protein
MPCAGFSGVNLADTCEEEAEHEVAGTLLRVVLGQMRVHGLASVKYSWTFPSLFLCIFNEDISKRNHFWLRVRKICTAILTATRIANTENTTRASTLKKILADIFHVTLKVVLHIWTLAEAVNWDPTHPMLVDRLFLIWLSFVVSCVWLLGMVTSVRH